MVTATHDNLPLESRLNIGPGYQLEEEISRGPAASIYRATALEDSQPVAIKIFHPRYHTDPRFAIHFREHLRCLAGIIHPNLVRVHDYGVDHNQYYIVMDWVEGTDLGSYLAEYGSLNPVLTVHLARQICAALDAVHQHGLVHQGIKPHNILLTAAGQIKLSDVGLSRLISESGLSKTHVMLGGVGYLSPDLALGKELTPQSDLYSLGVILFEMLTGRLPFEANDSWSVVRMHIMDPPPSLQQYNAQVPTGLADIVNRALQKDPELRYSSAADMEAALIALEKDSSLTLYPNQQPDGQADETGYFTLLKEFLKPEPVWRLLQSPWQIAGYTIPFSLILIFQFILVFIIAFAILFFLAGIL